VITDGLGLVVASSGDYAEALAAYGAFLAGIGAKTRDALPLRELRQVVIQDEHDMTLTVRPIISAEDELSLVTLAGGQRDAASADSYVER
jgi:predicted regulator of Ras-like GTPase activity (Roadblock/LC7/MglB family)